MALRANPAHLRRGCLKGLGALLVIVTVLKNSLRRPAWVGHPRASQWVCLRSPAVVRAAAFEVRFAEKEQAEKALTMHGASFNDVPVEVLLDWRSQDGVKLEVRVPGELSQEDTTHLMEMLAAAGKIEYFGDVSAAVVGEVRFGSEEGAIRGASKLHESELNGFTLTALPDPESFDKTRVVVTGMSPLTRWGDLKDHITKLGLEDPKFVDVKPSLAEVRFAEASMAAEAAEALHNSLFMGAKIRVVPWKGGFQDKLEISGFPTRTPWFSIKALCSPFGKVEFVEVWKGRMGKKEN